MIILDYNKKNHKEIIHACVEALKQGKVVVYPTDTCYGLAVDAENLQAIKHLYKVKGRSFKKPVSIIPSSLAYAKKIILWSKTAGKLAKKFFPGALTLVLECRIQNAEFRMLTANTGELGIRMPKNSIALDLAKVFKKPITTTSANLANEPECYSLGELQKQFQGKKYKPDIFINAGKLKHQHPSTLIKINQDQSIQVLREGPISLAQINKILNPCLPPACR